MLKEMLIPAGNTLSKTQKLKYASELQLKSIGALVLRYKTNFHSDPVRLSQIVPPDRIDFLPIFYAPNRAGRQRPNDWQSSIQNLDLYSDYAIPSNMSISILVFEKPGMWKDGTVAVCMTNLSVVRITVAELENLLLKESTH